MYTQTHTNNVNGNFLSTTENEAVGINHYECFMVLMNREILAIRIRKVII